MPAPPHGTSPAGWLRHPVVLAAVVTLVNAGKPAVVDDTAYLLFARQIATNPFDPYGFDIFWYTAPEPAMDVLAPPLLPYWLAVGIRLFGEHLVLLKFWLFPFPLVLAFATRSLLARFAPGAGPGVLPAVVLGPGVLPFLNVMLDVPALALEAAAVALFARAVERRVSWAGVISAGLCAGLAAQTKYSVFALPAVIVWYGIISRRLLPAGVCVAIAVGVFVGWEGILLARYGVSHFAHQLAEFVGTNGPVPEARVWSRVEGQFRVKWGLVDPLLAHLGATVWWVAPFGWVVLGGRPVIARWACVAAAGVFIALLVVPGEWTTIRPGPAPSADRLSVNALFFGCLGGGALAAGLVAAGVLCFRRRKGDGPTRAGRYRHDAAGWFLAGWLLIELAAYFVLTPFPAGRRVLGVSFVLALVVAAADARLGRLSGRRHVPGWVTRAAAASGLVLAGIDTLDAWPERALPERAAALARERGWPGTGWYVGHWGFQYYCERNGLKPLLPDRCDFRPGDWIVTPVFPDPVGFYRPYDGGIRIAWDPAAAVPEAELVWHDCLSAQTVPNLYGGKVPVVTRKHPRLRVVVYRVVGPWRPTAAPPS